MTAQGEEARRVEETRKGPEGEQGREMRADETKLNQGGKRRQNEERR